MCGPHLHMVLVTLTTFLKWRYVMYERRCSLIAWIAYCALEQRHGNGVNIARWSPWHLVLYFALNKLDSKALKTIYEMG